jgi:hypothetical protein
MISVNTNAKSTLRTFDGIISGFDAAVERGLSKTAFKGQSVAKAKSKGSVSASVGVTQTPDGYELQARAPYARFVEYGRGPVVAQGNGFLRFEVGGRVVYTRRVRAARPRPFMAPAKRVMSTSRFVEMSLAQLMRGAT